MALDDQCPNAGADGSACRRCDSPPRQPLSVQTMRPWPSVPDARSIPCCPSPTPLPGPAVQCGELIRQPLTGWMGCVHMGPGSRLGGCLGRERPSPPRSPAVPADHHTIGWGFIEPKCHGALSLPAQPRSQPSPALFRNPAAIAGGRSPRPQAQPACVRGSPRQHRLRAGALRRCRTPSR